MFDSSPVPWTVEEVQQLQAALAKLYPVAKQIYGAPAYDLTVNVRKGDASTFTGEYDPALNEIRLDDATRVDVLAHEMLHAFRDESMVRLSSFEEGMVRAAEIEIFNRLPDLSYPIGRNHSYTYDVYYEGLNKPVIGARHGDFYAGYTSALLRYQLAGYAWGKALLENPLFLSEFNRELFAEAALDALVLSDEPRLVAIAEGIQPTVEGKTFLRWYGQQGVLNTSPAAGYFLFNRVNQWMVDYFFRNDDGLEIMLAGMPLLNTIYDCDDLVLATVTTATSPFGVASTEPPSPLGYTGRLKLVATAALPPTGEIGDTTFGYAGDEVGVFGIIQDQNSGLVRIVSLDDSIPPVEATVVHGAFTAASLTAVRGRFVATFTDPAGRQVSRQFTKDASAYFLPITSASAVTDVAVQQVAVKRRVRGQTVVTYTITISNQGTSDATDLVLINQLPPAVSLVGWTADNAAVITWPVPINGIVTANWDTLPAGSSTTIALDVRPDGRAQTLEANRARIYAGSLDADSGNNASDLSVSLGK
jgi:uncharacterized repeat protein (TIGR01451 family)